MTQPAARQAGALSRTSNEDYGSYDTDWQRINTTKLPHIVKNKQLEQHQRSFRTASEEYGNFWSSRGRALPIPPPGHRHRSIGRLAPLATPTYLPESRGVSEDEYRSDQTKAGESREAKQVPLMDNVQRLRPVADPHGKDDSSVTSQAGSRGPPRLPVVSHPPYQTNGNRRTGAKNIKIRQTRLSQQRISSRESQVRDSKGQGQEVKRSTSRNTNMGSKPRNVTNSGTAGLRLNVAAGNDITVPELDLKRIDLDLHTKDGRVITISAVPVFISSFKK